jgi:hypothetical protein
VEIMTVPKAMAAPTQGAQTTSVQIEVFWVAPTGVEDTGNLEVTGFKLEHDGASSGATWHTVSDTLEPEVSTYIITTDIVPAAAHLVRVSAKNVIGWGPASPNSLGIVPRTIPSQMGAPVEVYADIDEIKVSWTALTTDAKTGASPITSYVLEWDNGTSGLESGQVWTAILGGASDSLAVEHTINNGDMVGATQLTIVPGQAYQFRVYAKNAVGDGPLSVSISVDPVQGPAKMAAPVGNAAATDYQNIAVEWAEMTTAEETGGVAINGYILEWDDATNQETWTTLVDYESNGLAYTVGSNIVPGETYSFRVKCYTDIGTSTVSDVFSVVPQSAPGGMSTPLVYLSHDNLVKISWNYPEDRGSAISEYRLWIKDLNGDDVEETTYCADATSAAARACEIPLYVFREAPYSLEQLAKIELRIESMNSLGYGPTSGYNTNGAALPQVTPLAYEPPAESTITQPMVTYSVGNPDVSWEDAAPVVVDDASYISEV